MTSWVLYPPAPPITGTLPLASSSVISTTRRCSARVSVGLSPVVPQGTRKSMPLRIWRCTRRRIAASSSERSRRKGVTSAVPHPRNIRSPLFKHYVAEFVHAAPAHDPLCGFQSAAREPFPAARRVPQRDGVGG